MTMLRRADGHSGDLKIPGRKWNKAEPTWMKATQFDREARMSKATRLKAMRELIARGLVTATRPRVYRVIGGRMRAVAGPTHYTVHRAPATTGSHEKAEKSSRVKAVPDPQESNSSKVEKVDQQFLSNTPLASPLAPARIGVDLGLDISSGSASSSSPRVKFDDNDSPCKSSVEEKPRINLPTLDPALRSWMKTQILARAPNRLKSRGAYLRASYPQFIEDLGEEIESYLQSKAEQFMRERIEEAGSVDFDSVCEFLQKEALWHALPIGEWTEDGQESEEFSVTREDPDSVHRRIYNNAAEVLGLR